MRLSGVIKDASKEEPVPDVKVSLYVDGNEPVVLYSGNKGEFEHDETTSYIGKTLTCRVEKEGYSPQEVIYKIEQDDISLEIELSVPEPPRLGVTFNVRDKDGNPLADASILLMVDGEQGAGSSDKDGVFRRLLSSSVEGKTLAYKVKRSGYKPVRGQLELVGKETSCGITMEEVRPIWRKLAIVLAIVIAAIAILVIVRYFPPDPRIGSFYAEHQTIVEGQSTVLHWETSKADKVSIKPDIGEVKTSGSKEVSPGTTTKYCLYASNRRGEVDKELQIAVIVRSTIGEFAVDRSAIGSGQTATLTWITSGADTVRIDPGIGTVGASGRRTVSPDSTTVYTLTAENAAGPVHRSITITVITARLPAPERVSPRNETNVSPVLSSGQRYVELKWGPVDRAAGYVVAIRRRRRDGNWEPVLPVLRTEQTSCKYKYEPSFRTYSWQVWAVDGNGTEGAKSDSWQFTVSSP